MTEESGKRASVNRLSSSSFKSHFSMNSNTESETDDPISAYFKQRCKNSNKSYLSKNPDSDSESSLGIIDVDNISLFDVDDIKNIRLSECSFGGLKKLSVSPNSRKYSNVSKASTENSENDIEKQRKLAQKALMNINNENPLESILTPEKSRDSCALSDISSKVNNVKLSNAKELSKKWFQPHFSPNTPRHFNDELSSFGGEESLSSKVESDIEKEKSREVEYNKKVNALLKEMSQVNISPDLQFETQSEEEQLNRFEEDEKQFKLEKNGVRHNSEISEFSGIDEEICQWASDINNQKSNADPRNLSIGQFFNMRSNRVSSLLGSTEKEKRNSHQQNSDANSLTDIEMKNLLKNELSLPISDQSSAEKVNLRRCMSTNDLKPRSETPKNTRYSNDSCTSNSTVMIQNILAEMESGLSGTQIYEMLMNFGKSKVKKKELDKVVENDETPKTSKEPRKRELISTQKKKRDKSLPVTPSSAREKESEFVLDLKEDLLERKGTMRLIKNKKGFDSSTPKQLRVPVSKVVKSGEYWETPRISLIQTPTNLNKSVFSEENDKTISANSGSCYEVSKKNGTILLNDTLSVEDTIVAGDLTVLSQRIDEMKRDSVCIVRQEEPEEPVLLTVIQKLASLPRGSVDCSALTPLLRDQFPELLSSFPTFPSPKKNRLFSSSKMTEEELIATSPGSWVKLPGVMGYSRKITVCAFVEQTLFIPITNVSKIWVLLSLDSVSISFTNGTKIIGEKDGCGWSLSNLVYVSMKEVLVPPNNNQSIQVLYTPELEAKFEMRLTFTVRDLLKQGTQTRSVRVLVHVMDPTKSIKVTPNDSINFGVIADQCSDYNTVQVMFDGVCRVPITIQIEEESSQFQNFKLMPCDQNVEGEWTDKKINYEFYEGEKQLLEFRVYFQPTNFSDIEKKTQELKAMLLFRIQILNSGSDSGFFQAIPVKGSVGLAKFVCHSSCNPLIFQANQRGQSITKSYPLKNVGYLPIALSAKITNEETGEEDTFFVAQKSIYLSRNEESALDITFNANTNEECIKRTLSLQITPNGEMIYEAELIGLLSNVVPRPHSQASCETASTKSIPNSLSVPIKILTTSTSLSWPAVNLEKEMRQSFLIKNASSFAANARLSFKKNLDSFKFINENGEKVKKIRKTLKPDCPYTVTVSFRPDSIGPHHDCVLVEFKDSNTNKMFWLNGIGGMPNLFMANVKSDLTGCKILTLQNQSPHSQVFTNMINFKNTGRVPGFVLIRSCTEAFSLNHDLIINPMCCVIAPNTCVTVKFSQKLKNEDLKHLLSGKDISKLATLSICMGDEPSRLRLRKLVTKGEIKMSDRIRILTDTFYDEKEMDLNMFHDSPKLENNFLRSLKTVEVAVVIERSTGTCEQTIIEDADETIEDFVSVVSATDTIISFRSPPRPPPKSELQRQPSQCSTKSASTVLSGESCTPHHRVSRWLETCEQ